jgi:4-hydroxy-3-polyprenylbenzoate decarboxylase
MEASAAAPIDGRGRPRRRSLPDAAYGEYCPAGVLRESSVGRYIIAMTGASGATYGVRLIEALAAARHEVACVVSGAARGILADEVGVHLSGGEAERAATLAAHCRAPHGAITCYLNSNGYAPIASGSARWDGMVISPCSMNTLAAVAHGLADNLILRAADCTLKEGRRLILVPRETPFSAIHLENMLRLAHLGVHIIPPIPAFYTHPRSVAEVVDGAVARVLDHLGVDHDLVPRWQGRPASPEDPAGEA